jgi:hypothetical protein
MKKNKIESPAYMVVHSTHSAPCLPQISLESTHFLLQGYPDIVSGLWRFIFVVVGQMRHVLDGVFIMLVENNLIGSLSSYVSFMPLMNGNSTWSELKRRQGGNLPRLGRVECRVSSFIPRWTSESRTSLTLQNFHFLLAA